MALTYAEYLEIDKLLSLQKPRSSPAEHDEMLFIVIHQVYELWFRLMLHETDRLKVALSENNIFVMIETLKRMRMTMKTLVGQLDILETMTPLSFSSFRDRLETASGFQSSQFRELEFAFGYKRANLVGESSPIKDTRELKRRFEERSVMDHFYDFLVVRGVAVPEVLRSKEVTASTQASEELQDELLKLYKQRSEMITIFELMLDLDEGLQEWRYRHVKMVERTIGQKYGTGGSPGVDFLKRTLFQPLFPDLWAIRHRM